MTPRTPIKSASRKRVPSSQALAVPPLTVSRSALLTNGSDRRFRTLVHDLFTIANRMNAVRDHLGRKLRLSGPQYSLLMAVAQLQGEEGVSVGRVADNLHVSAAFVASQSGILVEHGFLTKQPSSRDRRSMLLRLSPKAVRQIGALAREICAINDKFFKLDKAAFEALTKAASAIVESSADAVSLLHAGKKAAPTALL